MLTKYIGLKNNNNNLILKCLNFNIYFNVIYKIVLWIVVHNILLISNLVCLLRIKYSIIQLLDFQNSSKKII